MRSPLDDAKDLLEELSLAEFEEYERRVQWLEYDAREEQLTPEGDWKTWLYLAGRGAGKTRAAGEDVAAFGLDNPKSRIAVVAETFADGRDTCVEGESGLLSILPEQSVKYWNRSLGELVLTNGTRYKLYSGDKPNQLRGPQHHRAWVDELAKYQYPDETWTQLQLGLRLGEDPRNVVTTTPRPIPLIRSLVDRENVIVTTGSTFDNAPNLSESFLEEVRREYEGTKLGEQELYGRIVELDGESIFKREWWRQPGTRYDYESGWIKNRVRRRYLSFDTALKDKDDSDYTACAVFEVLEDYTVLLREAWRERLAFPALLDAIRATVYEHNADGLLRGCIIEDKVSGTSALQTLAMGADRQLAAMLIPFVPTTSKDERARQAAFWCRMGLVLLPEDAPWLLEFQEELFQIPMSEHRDQGDAFAQGVIYLEELLSEKLHSTQRSA